MEKARAIRSDLRSTGEIASEYSVSTSTVLRIKAEKSWREQSDDVDGVVDGLNSTLTSLSVNQ